MIMRSEAREPDSARRDIPPGRLEIHRRILDAIVQSAKELLHSRSVPASIPKVLELIGCATDVERVHLLVIDTTTPLDAHHVVDHRREGYLNEIMAITGGRGVDVILEMLANLNLAKDLTLLALRGRVVVIGNRGSIEINPRATMQRDASILGLTLLNATKQELFGIHAAIVAGLENGALAPVVGRQLPLAQAAQAHTAVLEPGAYGKIVLIP